MISWRLIPAESGRPTAEKRESESRQEEFVLQTEFERQGYAEKENGRNCGRRRRGNDGGCFCGETGCGGNAAGRE